MSNSVSLVPQASAAMVDAGRSAALSHGTCSEDFLRAVAAFAQAVRNVRDPEGRQGHRPILLMQEDAVTFCAVLGDWSRLDFDAFASCLPQARAVYRALGVPALDDRRNVLVAVFDQVRAAEATHRAVTSRHTQRIREFVGEVADGVQDEQVAGLAREINEVLVRLEGVHSGKGRRGNLVPQVLPLDAFIPPDDPNVGANLTRSMLAQAEKVHAVQQAEWRRRDWEDGREADYQYDRVQGVKRQLDMTEVRTAAATRVQAT